MANISEGGTGQFAWIVDDCKILWIHFHSTESTGDLVPLEKLMTLETCCLLERLRNAKDYVTFTLDMEDYYRIKDAEADKKNDSTN